MRRVAAVVGGLRSAARKYRLGRYPRFPTRRAFEPVVGSTGIGFPRLKAIRHALDDTGFPAPAPDQRVNRGRAIEVVSSWRRAST